MNLEECITTLIKRLQFVGYTQFEVRNIINEAIGQDIWEQDNSSQNIQILTTMEKYIILGNDYLLAYSK